MTTPFETMVSSIRELSDDEFEAVISALEGTTPLDEYFEEALDSECPSWLKAWLARLEFEELYSADSGEAMGACRFGLLWDAKSNECWTYGGTVEPACRVAEVERGRSSLTPGEIWSLVREDLVDLDVPLIWCSSWLNPTLVERQSVEPFLREVLSEQGLDGMGGSQGQPLGEWLDALYG